MSETVRLLTENPIEVVMAAAFIVSALWLVRAYIKATGDFARIIEANTTIITNHTHDSNEQLAEIARILERVCVYVELPNRDYKK